MVENDAPLFGRLMTAMVTPFDEKGDIDYAAVEKIAAHLIKTGTTTILVAGTTGESPTLTGSEKLELLRKVVELARGKARVLFGAGSNNTASSIETSLAAEKAGADGLLIVAPYYNKPSQAGIRAHVKAIADATELPLVIYNIPGRTGINIEPGTMKQIAEDSPTVHAIKDSAGNVDQTAELAAITGGAFRIYSGDDYLTLPMVSVGACGVVSVASHLLGAEIVAMIEDAVAGKLDQARQAHYEHLPVFKGLFQAPNPTCLKYILKRLGFCQEYLRLPLVPLSDEQKRAMDRLVDEAGLASRLSCVSS